MNFLLAGPLFTLGVVMLLFVVLQTALGFILRRKMPLWAVQLLFLACCIGAYPSVQGLSIPRWVAGVIPGFSIPFLAVLLHATVRHLGGRGLFQPADLRNLWILGVIAGVLLYPMALGLGPWDPYASGWGLGWVFGVAGAASALLIVQGNHAGCVLLATIIAWHLRGLESSNYWDYLVDPVFFLVALAMVLWRSKANRQSEMSNSRSQIPKG